MDTDKKHLENINEMNIETLHISIKDLMEIDQQKHCSRVNLKKIKDEKFLINIKHYETETRNVTETPKKQNWVETDK